MLLQGQLIGCPHKKGKASSQLGALPFIKIKSASPKIQ